MQVHLSWPRGQVNRITRLCQDLSAARSEIDRFRLKFREFAGDAADLVLSNECAWDRRRLQPFSRIVIPFHPIWASAGLPKLLANAHSRFRSFVGEFARTSVAWSLGGIYEANQLLQFNNARAIEWQHYNFLR